MNKIQKTICGVVAGVTLTTLALTGCGKSDKEIQLEQQLANYQKKEEQQQQYDAITSAVKAGVDAAYKAQQGKTQEQLNDFYNKLNTPLADIGKKVDNLQTTANDIKTKQSELEAKIKAIPTTAPGITSFGNISDWQYISKWQVDRLWKNNDYYGKLDFANSFTDMQTGTVLWSFWTWNDITDNNEINGENDGMYISPSAGLAVLPVTTATYYPEQYKSQAKTTAKVDIVKLNSAIAKANLTYP